MTRRNAKKTLCVAWAAAAVLLACGVGAWTRGAAAQTPDAGVPGTTVPDAGVVDEGVETPAGDRPEGDRPDSPDVGRSAVEEAPGPEAGPVERGGDSTAGPGDSTGVSDGAQEGADGVTASPVDEGMPPVPATPLDEPFSGVPPSDETTFDGLDHTGTPPLPPLDGQVPSGEWNENYDGREAPSARAEDVLIWVPRLALFPVYLALEYVVRKPVVALISWSEENHVFERVIDFLTFADGKGFIFPSVFVVSGRGVVFGLNVTVNDVGPHDHNLALSAQYGTAGFYNVSLSDEWSVFENDVGSLTLAGQYGEDPTWAFYGVGPRQPIENEVFYGIRRGEVTADLRIAFHELNRLRLHLGYRNVQLVGGQDLSIDADGSPFQEQIQNGELFGFADPYNLFSLGLGFELDTRSEERQVRGGTGVRFEAFGTYNFTIGDPDLNFFKYGVSPSVFFDLSGVDHVLGFSMLAEALSSTNDNTPPINELVTIGGLRTMRAFLAGRSRGKSALSASMTYTWPVFFFLDGMLLVEMGNAFDGFYENFGLDRFLLDVGFGFRTSFSRGGGELDILFAWGSNRVEEWDEGFEFNSFRFILGVANLL